MRVHKEKHIHRAHSPRLLNYLWVGGEVTKRESDSKRVENEMKRCTNSIVLPRLGSRSESGNIYRQYLVCQVMAYTSHFMMHRFY